MIRCMRRPSPKLVQRLVSASEEVLRPDQALRLEDIALLIGSARATLYYHFSGRDDLVAFLLEENLRAAAETIELAVTTAQPPPVVQLRSAITALAGFLGGQPGVCAGLLSFAGATGRLGTLMAAKDAALAAPLRKLLDEGAATGQFTISDSRDAANAILGAALIATLTRWEDGRDTQDPEFQQALTDQLVRSVTRA
jgi:TetR/AcrR family transcriptional regulator